MNKPIRKEPKSHYLETADHRYGPALADTDFSAKRIGHIEPSNFSRGYRAMTYTVVFQNNAPVSASFNEVRIDGKFRSLFHVKLGAMETLLTLAEMAKLSEEIDKAIEQHGMAMATHVIRNETATDSDGAPFVEIGETGEAHTPFFTDGLCVTCGSTIRNHA